MADQCDSKAISRRKLATVLRMRRTRGFTCARFIYSKVMQPVVAFQTASVMCELVKPGVGLSNLGNTCQFCKLCTPIYAAFYTHNILCAVSQ